MRVVFSVDIYLKLMFAEDGLALARKYFSIMRAKCLFMATLMQIVSKFKCQIQIHDGIFSLGYRCLG